MPSASSTPEDLETGPPVTASLSNKNNNAATGASAAGMRTLASQAMAVYFRAPAKAFFRTRVDYMAFARAINPHARNHEGWSFRLTTPGLLASAVKKYGFAFIPNHVLPPMLANITVGAALYTTYLQTLGFLYPPAAQPAKRIQPPAAPSTVLLAGAIAGGAQSVIAAPLDALSLHFRAKDIVQNRYATTWHYGYQKIREIGLRGAYSGWSLSLIRDAVGFAVFFSTFEFVKSQACYAFMRYAYGRKGFVGQEQYQSGGILQNGLSDERTKPTIRPHFLIEPFFLLMAGIGASIAHQAVQHPLDRVSQVYRHCLDQELCRRTCAVGSCIQTASILTRRIYQETFRVLASQVRQAQSLHKWAYQSFWRSTISQVPSTSAGLIVFEIVRRWYGDGDEIIVDVGKVNLWLP